MDDGGHVTKVNPFCNGYPQLEMYVLAEVFLLPEVTVDPAERNPLLVDVGCLETLPACHDRGPKLADVPPDPVEVVPKVVKVRCG